MARRRSSEGQGPSKDDGAQSDPDRLLASANNQDKEAAELASKAVELEGEGRLAEAKSLTRASRHRRVESLKARAIARARKVL
jgi:hypothetical protein